jgi:hypothetical protein
MEDCLGLIILVGEHYFEMRKYNLNELKSISSSKALIIFTSIRTDKSKVYISLAHDYFGKSKISKA